ncbi:MAG: phosphatase PAP2 family protein [Planctomycetota bacterium]
MSTLERCWITYCAVVIAVALGADGGGADGHRPWAFAALHLGIAALQWLPGAARRRGWTAGRVRALRAALAVAGLPVVFSAMAALLPYVHPQPWEIAWYRVDLRVFGREATEPLRAALPAALVVALQCVYAAFYFVPIAAALAVGARSGGAAFDRAVTVLVGGFLCSYLGYLWFPTLAPKVVLPLADGAAAPGWTGLFAMIDAAEANPWDCFPSGHTMMSLCSVLVAWRWARPAVPWLLLVVVPLVASTMLLRYHWPSDVVAGALLCWPCMRAIDWLLDRDGAPPA